MARKKKVVVETPVVETPVVETPVVETPVVETPVVLKVPEVVEKSGVYYVNVDEPKMGGKIFLIEKKGIYVLESGEGVLRSLACTYVGSGMFKVYDGLPSESGHFDADRMDSYTPEYQKVNGRRMFTMSPQIIGFWGLDSGFKHGLTIIADGGGKDAPVFVSVVWMKHTVQKAHIEFGEE